MSRRKYIYMWFDGDVKRHYFSNKLNLNKFVKEFVLELKSDPDFGEWLYAGLKNKSTKEIISYFSSSMFVEKIELDL